MSAKPMAARAVPDLIVEPSAFYPPLSGIGYYTRELLKAYNGLPDHFPIKLLSYRFFLKSWRTPEEEYFASQAQSLGGSLAVRSRLVPSLVYNQLRRYALRPPIPLDLFRPEKPSIYFFPNYVGEPLIRSKYVPVIFDFGFLRYPRTLEGKDHLYLKRYVPRTLKRASNVVVISDCIKRELHKAYDFPPEKITVVYPAVDHASFRPDIPFDARASALAKYGLDSGYIFSLSTLEPRKNFPRLIEAYSLLPDSVKIERPLVVAGGQGWKNQDIFATIRRLGLESRIKFLGYISETDRAPLMREAALFVLPSLYEGFGMPVLEAMACGTPVVTSARGALPEVGGKAVVYADPLDVESICRGIRSVLENLGLSKRLSAAGVSRAATFQWSTSGRVLADVFKKAANSQG
jgi:glycosyltransferase involved in cell wall biosynthesis